MVKIKVLKISKERNRRIYYIEEWIGIEYLKFSKTDDIWGVDVNELNYLDRKICLFCESILRGLNSND